MQHPPPQMPPDFILGKLLEIQRFFFPLVCFVLLGLGLLLQSLLLQGNLNGGFPSYCKNPGKENVWRELGKGKEKLLCYAEEFPCFFQLPPEIRILCLYF